MMKRIFDVIFSLLALIILSPLLILIALLIKIDSKGSILFIQERVGMNNKEFCIYKFRTMCPTSQHQSLLTIGHHDSRITGIGHFLRRYKIDEFPQLINILIGNMSVVGPRPELRYFVNFYKDDDYILLSVKPGITSPASLKYINEVELLQEANDPESCFINTIMPNKIKMDKEYILNQSFQYDLKLIILTIQKVFLKYKF